MNVDFVDIRNYLKNKERNIFVIMFLYSVIISVLLILIIVFSSYIQKEVYYENILSVEDNDNYLIVDYENLSLVQKNKKVIINDKDYYYTILNIDVLNSDFINYKVKILIDLEKIYSEPNILKYKILVREESLLKYIIRIIKGG